MEAQQTLSADAAAPKRPEQSLETRELLVRPGFEALTEKGFSSTDRRGCSSVGVPKGSSITTSTAKEAFGAELIERYARYFALAGAPLR